MNATPAQAARTRTRTTTRAPRDPYIDAAQAARRAQRRLAELAPRGPGPYAVLLAIISEVSLYSRLNDQLGVDRLVEVSGMSRPTVQRALAFLVEHGIVERIVPPTTAGKGTPRGWIALPWPPPTGEARESTEATKPAVDNALGGIRGDTPPGVSGVIPLREGFTEKTPKSCMAVSAAATRRDGGRPVAALPVGVKSRIPNVRTLTEWNRPDRPTPDPARSAEREKMMRDIDARRDMRMRS